MAPPAASSGVGLYVKSRAPGSHLLQIDGYTIAKHAPNGTSFKSCPFTVGGYRWAIYLFPNGDRLDSADFISVFLALDEHVKGPIRVDLEFSFMDEVEKQDPAHVRARQVVDLYGGSGCLLCGASSKRKRRRRSRMRGLEEKGEAEAMEEGEAQKKDDEREVPDQCIFGMEDALEKFELTYAK
uniref:Uncharacterized protein n=1 Tax=Aegilops tauschii TaxID=37682 RepID=N1R2R3_AEGTA